MTKELTNVELDRDIEALNIVIQTILKKDNISFTKLIETLRKKREESSIIKVPSSIFRERSLGILEALTKYLKEKHNLSYHEIASLLNRDDRHIWATYNNANKKFTKELETDRRSTYIPITIFTNRKLGVLESLIKHLKDDLNFTNNEIAGLLNRDNKTIWTSYNRIKKKLNE